MVAMPSSADITPPESRPKENEESRRATDNVEVHSVDRAASEYHSVLDHECSHYLPVFAIITKRSSFLMLSTIIVMSTVSELE